MFRYAHDPNGLLRLASDLESTDGSTRLKAARALRSDIYLREAVNLVATFFRIADQQTLAGVYRDDPAKLEELRPLAAIVPRLEDLRVDPDPRIRRAAGVARLRLEGPPAPYARERLAFWSEPISLAVALGLPAVLAGLFAITFASSFWLTFAVALTFTVAFFEGVAYWAKRQGKAAGDAFLKARGITGPA